MIFEKTSIRVLDVYCLNKSQKYLFPPKLTYSFTPNPIYIDNIFRRFTLEYIFIDISNNYVLHGEYKLKTLFHYLNRPYEKLSEHEYIDSRIRGKSLNDIEETDKDLYHDFIYYNLPFIFIDFQKNNMKNDEKCLFLDRLQTNNL